VPNLTALNARLWDTVGQLNDEAMMYGGRSEMTYQSEIQRDCGNQGDVTAAWGVYAMVIFGLVGYSFLGLFA